MGFKKGHKINVGRKCSKKTREKIGISNSKLKLDKICKVCKKRFQVWPSHNHINHCGFKCASLSKKGKPTWNKGMIGYRAGKNHHWFGRDCSGEKNPSYIKDRNNLKKSITRRSSAYFEWIKEVRIRDNWICRINNEKCKGKIEVHHILNWIDYPELRYNINNGITLCHFHHPRKWEEEKQLIPIFAELVENQKN